MFGATVNREEFLIDDTGNRRFWVVQVGRTLEPELVRDRDQLWAEAAHLEKEGEPHNIPAELWAAAEEVAKQHTVHDPIAERVIAELAKLPKTNVVVTASDLYRAIGIEDITRQSGQVGRAVAAGARRVNWQSKLMRPPGVKTEGSVRCYHAALTEAYPTTYEYRSGARNWTAIKPI